MMPVGVSLRYRKAANNSTFNLQNNLEGMIEHEKELKGKPATYLNKSRDFLVVSDKY